MDLAYWNNEHSLALASCISEDLVIQMRYGLIILEVQRASDVYICRPILRM